jgi:hypothetical protein
MLEFEKLIRTHRQDDKVKFENEFNVVKIH